MNFCIITKRFYKLHSKQYHYLITKKKIPFTFKLFRENAKHYYTIIPFQRRVTLANEFLKNTEGDCLFLVQQNLHKIPSIFNNKTRLCTFVMSNIAVIICMPYIKSFYNVLHQIKESHDSVRYVIPFQV